MKQVAVSEKDQYNFTEEGVRYVFGVDTAGGRVLIVSKEETTIWDLLIAGEITDCATIWEKSDDVSFFDELFEECKDRHEGLEVEFT